VADTEMEQPEARVRRLREVERRTLRDDETVLLMETPYRNRALLESPLLALEPTTRLMVASELTTPAERIVVDTVEGWRRARREVPKAPAVFGIQARPARPSSTHRRNRPARPERARDRLTRRGADAARETFEHVPARREIDDAFGL